MGRAKRIHYKGAAYHAMSQGNDGCDIFLDDEDRLIFLGILEAVCRKAGAFVYAACLMLNHFHLLVEVALVPLSAIMQRVLARYARYFNSRHGRVGHLFRSRFKGKLCHDENYLLTALRYVHQNPVKDGFVQDAADWPWSSHRQYTGTIHSTLISVDRLLAKLGKTREEALKAYMALMTRAETPQDVEFASQPWEEFDLTDSPSAQPSLEDIASSLAGPNALAQMKGGGSRRSRELTARRREFAVLASSSGYSGVEIARFLGLHPTAISQYLSLPH